MGQSGADGQRILVWHERQQSLLVHTRRESKADNDHTNAVRCHQCNLELDALTDWQPVQHAMDHWCDVVVLITLLVRHNHLPKAQTTCECIRWILTL